MMRTAALAWLGIAAALAAAALAGAGRSPAWAEGAVAVGSTGNVVRDGIAFGFAIDEAKDAAGEIAVQRCRTFEAKSAAARCEVVATFGGGECFAIAYDLKPGTPGAGWGVGPDQLAANQKAVAMCEQAAGPARKGYCQVERFGCDSTVPRASSKPSSEAQGDTPPTPEAQPEAKAAPGADAKASAEAKAPVGTKSGEGKVDGQASAGPVDDKASKPDQAVKPEQSAKTDIADATPPAPPPPSPRKPSTEPNAAPDGSASRGGSTGASFLPILALAGVALAYAAGQYLRGRIRGGLTEWQLLTGGGLAVAAAIAVKLLDMAGAGGAVAAALAALIALAAAILT